MGFFDRFKRKHDTVERAASKTAAPSEAVQGEVVEKKKPLKQADKKVQVPVITGKQVLLQPIVTEKSESAGRKHGQYSFYVSPAANKFDIKRSFAAIYGILPLRVNIMRYDGDAVTFRRTKGMTRRRKKAVVTVPKGSSIDIVPASIKE